MPFLKKVQLAKLNKILSDLEKIKSDVEEISLDVSDRIDSRSDSWQESENGQLAKETSDALDNIQTSIDDAMAAFSEIDTGE